ncbi:DUF4411 family protein [Entomospira entomophila]|uniref:DUF4411 family protein n=1 Tax=Entomospira entomophila TaxID=2719988 RepID=A0A968GAR4_9SPIO|nr:DUF4411 family protein [Entomospira entomophilus]NIZ40930.1 DUF4411 family protein [Entomospira entomophilus]WDI35143.1 DUF4411 family protein [Entomospira entomophilus]
MQTKKRYLIDANIIIEPNNQYYHFDFTNTFWVKIAEGIASGQCIIIDKVYDEIFSNNSNDESARDDALNAWLKTYVKKSLLKVGQHQPYFDRWTQLILYIKQHKQYTQEAFNTWFDEDKVADPWLIAVAQEDNCTIVTHETPNGTNPAGLYKKIKIPNIANEFNIPCIGLFDMMRELQIKLDK